MDDRDRTHRDDLADDQHPNEDTGEVLGISRPAMAGEDRDRWERSKEADPERHDIDDETRRRERAGSRDVTEGTTGGTTPDTGGTGVYRRGSGATGTDIGS